MTNQAMLQHEFKHLSECYSDYVVLRHKFRAMKLERQQRERLIHSLDKIISEHRKTIEVVMNSWEGPAGRRSRQ